jgi:hypothetical protein
VSWPEAFAEVGAILIAGTTMVLIVRGWPGRKNDK